MTPGVRLEGTALPVRCPAGSNGPIHWALAAAEPGQVLVVDASAGREFGYWGELLTVSAIARGLAGVVVDGGIRDVRQIIALGFPTFAVLQSVRGTSKQLSSEAPSSAVSIGGIEIRRGDYLVGDDDGLVMIPAQVWSEARQFAEALELREVDYAAELAAGRSTLEVLNVFEGSSRGSTA